MVFGHKSLESHFAEMKAFGAKEPEMAVRRFHRELVQRIRILDSVAENFRSAGLISKAGRNNIDDAKNAFMSLEMWCQMYLSKHDVVQQFSDFVANVEKRNLVRLSESRIKLLEKHLEEEDGRLKTIIKCIHEILHDLDSAE
jgi:hypothetical protein